MTGKDIIVMKPEEMRRIHIIRTAMEKAITQNEAAVKIGVCERQVRRIVARVRAIGDRGIVHRLRGKKSNRAFGDSVKNKVLELFKDKYSDFGPTLASEKILERDKIKVNDETLRRWLVERNIPHRERRKRKHRQWRERKERYGEMIQIDGSHHNWFEDRGESCVLMGYIDDATGKPYARFYPYEGLMPAMDSFKRYIRKYGIPLSVYLDKHATYKSQGKPTIEDELNGTGPLSQFERALEELGVKIIHANSPQAKGRIERLFNTFQDRVVKEMRLNKISNIEKGNRFLGKYLPVYAKRFGVVPAEPEDMHRQIPTGIVLDDVLCRKTERILRNDYTIAHNSQLYQIYNKIRAKKVDVIEKLNGSMFVMYKQKRLRFKLIAARPQKQEEQPRMLRLSKSHKPNPNHPWLNYKIRFKNRQLLNEPMMAHA